MSLASLAGFGSVLMTFFGVNYYLSGLFIGLVEKQQMEQTSQGRPKET